MADTPVLGFQTSVKTVNLFSSLSQPRNITDFLALLSLLDTIKGVVPSLTQIKCELNTGTGWFEYKWVDPTRTWRQNFKKNAGVWTTSFPNSNPAHVFTFTEIDAHRDVRAEILRLIDAVSMTKLVCNWV